MRAIHDNATEEPCERTALGSGTVEKGASGGVALPGRYEDLGEIACGSFGEVRRVRDTLLERIVAMKLLRKEHADASHLRARFLTEVRITADLQHPGIVAVHDRGELLDGRLWFTMKEVRGQTLGAVIDELHAERRQDGFGATPSGWTFRRLVDAFARIAQAIAYAHRRGVVHRDLKPDNLMVGELGEVLVMDWGLARRMGSSEAPGGARGEGDPEAGLTRFGDILGTPAYMPPEQASGDTGLHGPRSDVYSLGAVLYCLLSGRRPFDDRGTGREVLAALRSSSPLPVREAARGGGELPAELCAVVERAMRREIGERYENAAALADDVLAWLDGARRREQAFSALEQARALEPEIRRLRAEAGEAEARARRLYGDLRPFDSIEKKRPAWQEQDAAQKLGRAAALLETRWLEAVHGSLSVDPALPEAHALLAEQYRERLVAAELEHRDEDAARAEELLRIHDRGAHAAFLRGEGRLTLVTDPPGAEVLLERYVSEDRRLVLAPEGVLGRTPLCEVFLQRGSYLVRLRAPGRAEVRYPVLMERDGCWDARAPGDREPFPIWLPEEGALGLDDVYVPAGFAWTGGDAAIPESLPRRRIWIDGLVVRRFPVTTGEYLDFLNDLVVQGREDDAIALCPKAQLSLAEGGLALAFDRDASGRFVMPPDREGLRWRLDWPVVLVEWYGAVAFAQWFAARTGHSWRLLDELEREKATRGVDGRLFPWGDHADSTFACVADSAPGEPSRESVCGHPFDESPYGVRGLAGNVRDWCLNVWTHEGPLVEGGRLRVGVADMTDAGFRVIKGGCWTGALLNARAAARFGGRPGIRRPVVGFRLARAVGRVR